MRHRKTPKALLAAQNSNKHSARSVGHYCVCITTCKKVLRCLLSHHPPWMKFDCTCRFRSASSALLLSDRWCPDLVASFVFLPPVHFYNAQFQPFLFSVIDPHLVEGDDILVWHFLSACCCCCRIRARQPCSSSFPGNCTESCALAFPKAACACECVIAQIPSSVQPGTMQGGGRERENGYRWLTCISPGTTSACSNARERAKINEIRESHVLPLFFSFFQPAAMLSGHSEPS